MATLEKIRSKQKLLFTIVIIALFLFIVSIASADSIRRMFGPGTTIAEVGKHKIDYQDHRQKIEDLQKQYENYYKQMGSNEKVDRDELSQTALHQLIGEALLKEQYDLLGIKATNKEIGDIMTSEFPPQAVYQFIMGTSQMLGLPQVPGKTAGEVLYEAITAPSRYNLTQEQLNQVAVSVFQRPSMAHVWANMENEVEKMIQAQTFNSLVSGLFTANMLDAQTLYNDNTNQMIITYVSSPYAAVSEDGIEVSDADIKAKYNEYKPLYKIDEETRLVDYIVVPIVPSAADYEAADLEADRLAEALQTQPGLEGASASSKFLNDNATVLVSNMKRDPVLSMISDSLVGKEKVYRFPRQNNVYNIVKVLDVKNQIDSINISMYVAASAAEADSIKDAIAAGTTFASIAEANPQRSVDNVWQSLIGAPEDLAAKFESAVVGQTFVDVDTINGTNAVYRVNERKAAKPVADLVLYTYELDPSNATIADIKTQLSSFLASNSKGDAFSANADSLYHLQHSLVTASMPRLGYTGAARRGMVDGTPDTRHAIQWAMNAKKGQVSPILEDNRDYYVVVALKDIYPAGYMPYTESNINSALRSMAIADKKGDKLVEQYQGKAQDINGYAQLMGAEARTDSTAVFSSPRFLTFGTSEAVLQGQVAGAPRGTVVGPVKGANEVVVFMVQDRDNKAREFNFTQDAQNFMRNFGGFALGQNDMYDLLKGNKKEKNNTLKFENYDRQ